MSSRGFAAALFLVATASAQNCAHTLKYAPVGPVLVYRSGVLLVEGSDFTTTKVPGTSRCCVVTVLNFADSDAITAVLMRQTGPVAYSLWSTSWNCTGAVGAVATAYPGVHADGKGGLVIDGELKFNSPFSGVVVLGNAAIANPPLPSPRILVLFPPVWDGTDTTGKPLSSGGVVDCGNMPPDFLVLGPVCIQLVLK